MTTAMFQIFRWSKRLQAIGHGPLGEQRRPAPADVLEDRRRPHHVQVRVLLACERGRRQVLCRRAGSDGWRRRSARRAGRARAGDRRREIGREWRSLRWSRRISARSACGSPPGWPGLGVGATAGRAVRRSRALSPMMRKASVVTQSVDRPPLDPRKLPEVRALAANDCDLRLVDLLEIQQRRYLVGLPPAPSASSISRTARCRADRPRLGSEASVSTPGVLAARPPPGCTTGSGGEDARALTLRSERRWRPRAGVNDGGSVPS